MASDQHSILKTLQWRIECLAHTALETLAGWLPGEWVFLIGEGLGALAWHLMPRRRRSVMRNLRVAFAGRLSISEMETLAYRSFRRAGANLLSVAHTTRLSPQQLAAVLEIENPECLQQALDKGRGVVLLLAHMGNWELLSRLTHLLPPGTPTGAFYRPLNNPLLNARVLARREADGTRMFSKGDPFHQSCRLLRDGGVVGILADQRVGLQGEVTPFFGRITRASPLPSLLARRTKCEVVALSLHCKEPGKWAIRYLPVAAPATTVHCTQALEAAMATSPIDVFWMQERWRCYMQDKFGLTQWLGEHQTRSEKPLRYLIWPPPSDADWSLPEHWQHPDVDYEVIGTRIPQPLPDHTRVHEQPDQDDRHFLCQWLEAIDRSHPLPIDGIIASQPPIHLRKAAKDAGLSFHLLPQ